MQQSKFKEVAVVEKHKTEVMKMCIQNVALSKQLLILLIETDRHQND